MAENKKRKLTEKDQTSFFDEEMMAEEPQIPEETDSDTGKNTSADSAHGGRHRCRLRFSCLI